MAARLSIRADLRVLIAPLLVAGCTACGETLPADPGPEQTPTSLEESDPTQQPPPGPPEGGTPVPSQDVDTLFRSSVSGLMTARREVVRSAPEWAALWGQLAGPVVSAEPTPSVDFANSQVVVLAMGGRPTGGYSIELGPVSASSDTLRVVVRERSPGPTCVTTQALTQPVLAVRLPLIGDDVLFVEEPVVTDCG